MMLRQLGPPILILVGPFAAAFLVWLRWGRARTGWTPRLGLWFTLLLAAQCLHFTEEYLTGFQRLFPALWGAAWAGDPARFAAWADAPFVAGNLVMDALWLLALPLAPRGGAWATYTLWLFVTGMLVNAVGHPLYALFTATHPAFCGTVGLPCWYFPGLITALLHAALLPPLLREWRRAHRAAA
ncbi:hypothetical protein [Deinococcus knuensis]|uniref:hypothetical protein n=1 Tax=Deinococcus knuensis TaxID=1837380 RepID=UPI00166A27C3|nr:hypothetical protein [Deinococcus knuensis]